MDMYIKAVEYTFEYAYSSVNGEPYSGVKTMKFEPAVSENVARKMLWSHLSRFVEIDGDRYATVLEVNNIWGEDIQGD